MIRNETLSCTCFLSLKKKNILLYFFLLSIHIYTIKILNIYKSPDFVCVKKGEEYRRKLYVHAQKVCGSSDFTHMLLLAQQDK